MGLVKEHLLLKSSVWEGKSIVDAAEIGVELSILMELRNTFRKSWKIKVRRSR